MSWSWLFSESSYWAQSPVAQARLCELLILKPGPRKGLVPFVKCVRIDNSLTAYLFLVNISVLNVGIMTMSIFRFMPKEQHREALES